MSEENPPSDFDAADVQRMRSELSREVHAIVIALLVESVDQFESAPKPWKGTKVSQPERDLAEKAIALTFAKPEEVALIASRTAAMVLVELCDQIGADPAALIRSFESSFFLRTLDI